MPSLNNIADQIADAKGKSNDFSFKQRVKQVFVQQAATYIKQQVDKSRNTELFVQYYLADLIKTDIVDECNLELGCTVLRTKNKIYRPLRVNNASLFEFVGEVSGEAYTQAKLHIKNEIDSLKYMKNVVKYDYRNGYIYVWMATKLKKLKIGMIPEDLRVFISDCVSGQCWDDDMEYPIPLDMIQNIKDRILSAEFNIDRSETENDDVELQQQEV